jgi:hypothetical protein
LKVLPDIRRVRILVQRADRRRDRHVVVVEDDQHVGIGNAGIVQRLEGHAGRHGAVADDGTTLRSSPFCLAASAMPSAAEIEVDEWPTPKVSYSLSLRLGKPETPPVHAQRSHASRRPVRYLVRIALVADVPDQPVFRRVEDVVQGDGQLDGAEIGRQVAAGLRDRFDEKARSSSPVAATACAPGGAGRPGC